MTPNDLHPDLAPDRILPVKLGDFTCCSRAVDQQESVSSLLRSWRRCAVGVKMACSLACSMALFVLRALDSLSKVISIGPICPLHRCQKARALADRCSKAALAGGMKVPSIGASATEDWWHSHLPPWPTSTFEISVPRKKNQIGATNPNADT